MDPCLRLPVQAGGGDVCELLHCHARGSIHALSGTTEDGNDCRREPVAALLLRAPSPGRRKAAPETRAASNSELLHCHARREYPRA